MWLNYCKNIVVVIFAIAIFVISREPLAWGPIGHEIIAENGCYTLPSDMGTFLISNKSLLAQYTNEPDMVWKDKFGDEERVKHFIDMDRYEKFPFSHFPHSYEKASKEYGARFVNTNGRLPWVILEFMDRLTGELKSRDWDNVLKTAGHLSHYVADAHQPLHTTENYDGQLTGNLGIHKSFESYVVDEHEGEYRFKREDLAGKAEYIEDPLSFVFSFIRDSYTWADNILLADLKAREGSEIDSEEYKVKISKGTSEIAQKQIRKASVSLGSIWWTCWVNAGKPEFPKGDLPVVREPVPLPVDEGPKLPKTVHNTGSVISWEDADKYYEEVKTVEGKIVLSHNSGKACFLNFHRNYKEHFTVVMFAKDFAKFPPNPERYYLNKIVRVTGKIQEYNNKPEIIVKDPSKIEIIEG